DTAATTHSLHPFNSVHRATVSGRQQGFQTTPHQADTVRRRRITVRKVLGNVAPDRHRQAASAHRHPLFQLHQTRPLLRDQNGLAIHGFQAIPNRLLPSHRIGARSHGM
ncbi:MAG: hypothetical protein MI924_36900, partial [Chloroflexales bacterium]|nr:hypothetical protein [Chloroflexales bacterium]